MFLTRLEQLEQSVAELKRQNRRYRLVSSFVAVLAVTLVIMGQSSANKPAKIIEAEKFVLRDKDGVVRGLLQSEKRMAAFVLADETGKAVIELGAKDNGATGLVFADGSGTTRVALGVKDGNSPDFGLLDAHGTLRVAMGIDPAGNPALVMYDEKQNPIWKPIWRRP